MIRMQLARWLDRLDPIAPKVVGWGCAIVLLGGLGYSIHLGDALRYFDEDDYVRIARAIVERGEVQGRGGWRALRPPLYPTFVAAFIGAGLPLWVARFANFCLLAASMWLLFRIASRWSRPAAGLLAAAWVPAYPVLLYTAGTLYPQTLAGTLLLCVVDAVAVPRFGWRQAAQAGLGFGLLVLNVPAFAPMLVVPLGYLALQLRATGAAKILVVAALAVAPAAAWSERNRAVLGGWSFVSTNSGVNLYFGNAPATTADSIADVPLENPEVLGLDELALSHYYRDRALRWMSENPGRAIKLYMGKFVHYFAVSDTLASKDEAKATRLRTLVMAATYGPLLAILIARLIGMRRLRLSKSEWMLIAFYVMNGAVAAAFFTRIRFRTPADVLLILLAALSVCRFAMHQPGRPQRSIDSQPISLPPSQAATK